MDSSVLTQADSMPKSLGADVTGIRSVPTVWSSDMNFQTMRGAEQFLAASAFIRPQLVSFVFRQIVSFFLDDFLFRGHQVWSGGGPHADWTQRTWRFVFDTQIIRFGAQPGFHQSEEIPSLLQECVVMTGATQRLLWTHPRSVEIILSLLHLLTQCSKIFASWNDTGNTMF